MTRKITIMGFLFLIVSCSPTGIPGDKDNGGLELNQPDSPAPGGKIVFETGDEGLLGDLFVVNEDGSGLELLLDSSENGFQHFGFPDWSPDGSQIVFSALGPPWELYIANADGSGMQKIEGTEGGVYPDWSPDGTRIAFTIWNATSDIYTINTDGTNLRQIAGSDLHEIDPSWSPNGDKIAFYGYRTGEDAELFIMNADGTGVLQLTDNDGDDWLPSWSPNGKQIAYIYGKGLDEYIELRVYDLENSFESQYTTEFAYPELSASPGVCWSPDGERIAFVSNGRIFTIHFDGGAIFEEIYRGSEFTGYPSWK